ncbi:hypothetical protein DFP72DRAFT_1106555 [Ephemerocybe angulata]|uniref:Uncharacterized protein n=1 Tax=Ephemerocybe angulata TaxID=980116 RepID=A0A8H6I3I7_9AGAR|nr:hypothetical protein DFP72DRAFT_1106555 [Tulosesus angulatus]
MSPRGGQCCGFTVHATPASNLPPLSKSHPGTQSYQSEYQTFSPQSPRAQAPLTRRLFPAPRTGSWLHLKSLAEGGEGERRGIEGTTSWTSINRGHDVLEEPGGRRRGREKRNRSDSKRSAGSPRAGGKLGNRGSGISACQKTSAREGPRARNLRVGGPAETLKRRLREAEVRACGAGEAESADPAKPLRESGRGRRAVGEENRRGGWNTRFPSTRRKLMLAANRRARSAYAKRVLCRGRGKPHRGRLARFRSVSAKDWNREIAERVDMSSAGRNVCGQMGEGLGMGGGEGGKGRMAGLRRRSGTYTSPAGGGESEHVHILTPWGARAGGVGAKRVKRPSGQSWLHPDAVGNLCAAENPPKNGIFRATNSLDTVPCLYGILLLHSGSRNAGTSRGDS